MILYVGGKYQGKLDIALKDLNLDSSDVFDFKTNNLNEAISKRVWYGIDEYIRKLAYEEIECEKIVEEIVDILSTSNPQAIVINEVGAGVIPIEKKENTFREAVGRVTVLMAEKSDEVYSVVCGLKIKLK